MESMMHKLFCKILYKKLLYKHKRNEINRKKYINTQIK